MGSAYRDDSKGPRQIVIARAGAPRMSSLRFALIAVAVAFSGYIALRVVRDTVAALSLTFITLGVFGFVVLMVRRPRFVVSRVRDQIEIREGRDVQRLLIREIDRVDIGKAARDTYAVFYVLTDGRRIALGEPHVNLEDAHDDRRALLAALDRG